MTEATLDIQPRTRQIHTDTDRTLTLERVLWDALERIAEREGCSITALITEIDRRRGRYGIQSALRLVALDYLRIASAHPEHPALLETVLGRLNPI